MSNGKAMIIPFYSWVDKKGQVFLSNSCKHWSPQNFVTFSFNPFTHWFKIFKAIPIANPKLLNLVRSL